MKLRVGLVALGFAAALVGSGHADEPPAAETHKLPNAPETPAATPAQPAAATEQKPLDAKMLFATTCGWCHSDAGRSEGKGPQLMNTKRSDEFIRDRIIYGKPGRMPSFGASFSLEDIDAIIAYIRALKPD